MEQTHKGQLEKLMTSARAIVRANAGLRVDGKVASNRTQEYAEQVIVETCRRLHRLGYYLEDIKGLGAKHVEAIVKDWHRNGLKPKTVQNQYSRLKIFCGWLGRPGIIDHSGVGVAFYLPDVDPATLKVQTYIDASGSWSGNGIDVTEIIRKAIEEDKRHGNMLRLALAFGLRKKELLRIKPWGADKITYLAIEGSTAKNGKERDLFIDPNTSYGKFQRWCLDEAKKVCGKYQTLGWPGLTIKQSENRYYHFMKKLGATKTDLAVVGHGLRKEFMENQAMNRGMLPPALGGTSTQMPMKQMQQINLEVGLLGGHEKGSHTISSYYGSIRKYPKSQDIGIRAGIVAMGVGGDSYQQFAEVFLYPPVQKNPVLGYRRLSDIERADTLVTIVTEKLGDKPEAKIVHNFLTDHPEMASKIMELLRQVGM